MKFSQKYYSYLEMHKGSEAERYWNKRREIVLNLQKLGYHFSVLAISQMMAGDKEWPEKWMKKKWTIKISK